MDINAYLARIEYRGSLLPTSESLRDLQLSHLLAVPFENLSIHTNEPILLQEDWLFDKIVRRRRGGFCYELNGLFAVLLRQLGFRVTLLSAGVARPDGSFGPDFDHLALLVELDDRWLVDVGFGDSFRLPLLLDRREAQPQGERSYQIVKEGEYLTLKERDNNADSALLKAQYRFTLRPNKLSDYEAMCHYHQTSPATTFTQKRMCSIARPDGRVTLSDLCLIETTGNKRRERVLTDDEEYAAVLAKEFGIIP